MSAPVSPIRQPLITGHKTYHQITEDLCTPTERTPNKAWVIAFLTSVTVLGFGLFCIAWTIWFGIGSWNLNRTVGWGWDITNFVWWIGIGHAGTLISAILLLFRQKWRTGVNRAAERLETPPSKRPCNRPPSTTYFAAVARSITGIGCE